MKSVEYKGYQVFDDGSIIGKRGNKLKFSLHNSGYYVVNINNKICGVNKVVYEAFNGEVKQGNHVDHINRDKLDNRLDNLQESTPSENLKNRNEFYRMSQRHLTGEQVRFIRNNYPTWTIEALANKFNLAHTTIRAILLNKSYKNI